MTLAANFELQMRPDTVRTLPKLVKAAEKCAKNAGKKTISNEDKFHKSHVNFLYELGLTVQAFLEEEKREYPQKTPSSTYEIVQELDGLLINFKSVNPNHPLGYEFIFNYFRESTNLLIDEINILLHRPKAKSKEDYGPSDQDKLDQGQVDALLKMYPEEKDSLWIKNITKKDSPHPVTSKVSQKPILTPQKTELDQKEKEPKKGQEMPPFLMLVFVLIFLFFTLRMFVD